MLDCLLNFISPLVIPFYLGFIKQPFPTPLYRFSTKEEFIYFIHSVISKVALIRVVGALTQYQTLSLTFYNKNFRKTSTFDIYPILVFGKKTANN